MNRKRRILILAALVAFSAIIVYHYTNWAVLNYESAWVKERDATRDDISIERSRGHAVTILNGPWTEHLPPYPDLELYKVKIEGPLRFYLGTPVIRDIRMPLFVLGVFFVGLFCVLGPSSNHREKSERKLGSEKA